jgi:hypothetical protein
MRVCRKILSLPPASFIHSLWAGPAAAVQSLQISSLSDGSNVECGEWPVSRSWSWPKLRVEIESQSHLD